jgi:hypothetical protein
MTTAAINAHGSFIYMSDGSGNYTKVAEIKSFQPASLSRDTLDATSHDSTVKEYIGSLVDGGEVTFNINYIPTNTSQENLRDNLADGDDAVSFLISYSDYGTSQTVTFDDTADDCTAVGHGFYTGQAVKFSSSGSLPSEVTAGTVYFVDRADANDFTLHSTNAAAVAGTGDIDFSSAGTGTHSVLNSGTIIFDGLVTKFDITANHDGTLEAAIGIKVTAKPTFA